MAAVSAPAPSPGPEVPGANVSGALAAAPEPAPTNQEATVGATEGASAAGPPPLWSEYANGPGSQDVPPTETYGPPMDTNGQEEEEKLPDAGGAKQAPDTASSTGESRPRPKNFTLLHTFAIVLQWRLTCGCPLFCLELRCRLHSRLVIQVDRQKQWSHLYVGIRIIH